MQGLQFGGIISAGSPEEAIAKIMEIEAKKEEETNTLEVKFGNEVPPHIQNRIEAAVDAVMKDWEDELNKEQEPILKNRVWEIAPGVGILAISDSSSKDIEMKVVLGKITPKDFEGHVFPGEGCDDWAIISEEDFVNLMNLYPDRKLIHKS